MERRAELPSGGVVEGAALEQSRPGAAHSRGWLSLRGEFLGLALLFVAVAASVVVYEHDSAGDAARHSAEKMAAAGAAVAALQISTSVGNVEQEVDALATSPTVDVSLRDPAGCNLTFNLASRAIEGHLDLLRPDGAVVCSSMRLPGDRPFTGYAGQAWVHPALTTPSVSAPVFDPRLHAMVLRITIPAPHRSGIAEASIELAPITSALALLYSDGNPDEFLLVNDGKVLSDSNDPTGSVGRSVAGTPFAQAGGPLPTRDLDGTGRIYGEGIVPILGWKLFVGEDTQDALASTSSLFHRELVIIVVGLALTLATLLLVYQQLARPIARLAAAVRANSVAPTRVAVDVAGPGEVRALSEDVNGLISAVEAELRQREQAEARVRDLAAIVESSNEAIISVSLAGTITSWNPAAERLYGYSEAEAVGRPKEMLIPEERRAEAIELQARVRDGGSVDGYETVRLRKDASPVEVAVTIWPISDDAGTMTGFSVIARDVGELRRAHEAARRLEESYRVLFHRHPAPMWVFDPETLRFLMVNDAAITSYGYSREEFLTMTIEDIRPEEERAALRHAMAEDVSGHDPPSIWRHRKKDGSPIEVAISRNTVDFEGRPARLVLAQDVTEQRRLEQHLRQAQKMDAVGNLAGGIAHDFNNTLTVIRATVDLMLPSIDDERTRERIQQIELAAEHAATLTRQLLAFSRLQVLHLEPIDLNQVVNESLDLATRLLGENIVVERKLESPLAPIMADRGQLQQVIINLAINARDAMPDGGTLSARTSRVVIDERYAAAEPDLEPGRYLLLELTDTGSGIDPEAQSRVFDPFFTTKQEGTGLGLATVYGIVKQSGGHITFYSEPGLGTTFRVYLPPADSPSTPPAPAQPKTTPRSGSETILLVEDAELLRPLTVEVLTGFGYTVLSAADGEAALQLASEHEGTIDLLLTDVVMPRMNGRELAQHLLRARPGLRVIFTSGYPADNMIRHGIATAQVAFIQKPYLANDLAAAIRAALDQ